MIPAKYYKDIKLQSGAAQKLQSGAGTTKWGKITKWGITGVIDI